MSRSWRGGGVLPSGEARPGASGHRSALGTVQRGVLFPARFSARRWRRPPPLWRRYLRPHLAHVPFYKRVALVLVLPPKQRLSWHVAMQPRFDSVAHPPHPSASHQPCSPAMFRIYAHALRALCSANQSCCPLVGWLLVSMATALSLTTALLCLCHKRLGFPSETLRTATEFAIGAVYFRASTSPAPNCGCRHTWLG